MTVNTHLTSLASNLVLSDVEKVSISTSITTLSSRLSSYFGENITGQLQFGSSTRGTILPHGVDSRSDIDYMIIFDTSDGQKKPQSYLDRLKKFAEARYSTSEITQSNPTIALSLNHIRFELVPAVYNFGYQIPSPASSWTEWISTDPTGSNQAILDKNKAENYQIKPLVRLIKYWNVAQGRLYTPFSLEQYIVSKYFLSCTTLRDYFYAFWDGFSYAYDAPQNTKDRVDRAKRHVAQAKEYENKYMPDSAESEINKIVPAL